MHDANQDMYDALHGIQLWGIVGQTRDPLLGKGRAGSNDEFLVAYKKLEERVDAIVDENAKLRELARDLRFCARQSICLKCKHGRICDLRIDERCAELGIEVYE